MATYFSNKASGRSPESEYVMAGVATAGVVDGRSKSYQAGAAGIGRGLAIVQGADDLHVIVSGANAAAFGISSEATVNVGDTLSVVRTGDAVGIAGAAVASGQYLVSDAQARLIPSTAIGDNVVGRAVTSAALANDELIVNVAPFIR